MLETIYDPTYPEERCGLELSDGSLIEIENVAEDKANSYDMNPVAVVPFLDAGVVAGTWHTHPAGDPNLSGEDRSGFLNYPHMVHSIVGLRNGVVTVTRWKVQDGLVISCS